MSASSSDLIASLGDELHAALLAGKPVAPLSGRGHDLAIEHAYAIQQRMVGHRLQAGEKIVGKKVGATSVAVQNMLGVRQPDFGMLLSGMIFNEGDVIPFDSLIQPKAEGEIAFILKRDITGPGVTIAEVISATECVMPCFEIVDSRIENWKLKIQDTVADNASCGVFALGGSACNPRRSISISAAWCWSAMAIYSPPARAPRRSAIRPMPSPGSPIPWVPWAWA